jgi:DNA adenine methylase
MDELYPFLKWAGGKRWLVQNYEELFPKRFNRFVEPFLGGGAVFFHLAPKRALLSDLNCDLIDTYKAIRDDWKGVWTRLRRHQLAHLKSPDEYYYEVRASAPKSDTAKAAKFIYLNRTCWNGLYRVNLRGEFNVPRGTKDSVLMPDDDFEALSERLQASELVSSDFAATLKKCGKGDFVFVDPPYTANHNYNGFLKYNEKIFSWEDQERLAACVSAAVARGAAALVTNAAHSSVRKLYRGLGTVTTVSRHSVLASESSRRLRVEEIAVRAGY